MMQHSDAAVDALLSARVLIISPHMDDEILGCGGVMSLHTDKNLLHCVFATDGAKSPLPLLPWQGRPEPELPKIREREARDALGRIGLPENNLTFLGFSDGRLAWKHRELMRRLEREIARIRPTFILVPFRYDRHPDHIAVHRAVRKLVRQGRITAQVLEYFVYIHWRLIPGRDIRNMVSTSRLVKIDIAAVAEQKRNALGRYRSQTSIMYPWQESPILTEESIRWRFSEPECFLVFEPEETLLACFRAKRYRILCAHYLERFGKRRKDQLLALVRWPLRRSAG